MEAAALPAVPGRDACCCAGARPNGVAGGGLLRLGVDAAEGCCGGDGADGFSSSRSSSSSSSQLALDATADATGGGGPPGRDCTCAMLAEADGAAALLVGPDTSLAAGDAFTGVDATGVVAARGVAVPAECGAVGGRDVPRTDAALLAGLEAGLDLTISMSPSSSSLKLRPRESSASSCFAVGVALSGRDGALLLEGFCAGAAGVELGFRLSISRSPWSRDPSSWMESSPESDPNTSSSPARSLSLAGILLFGSSNYCNVIPAVER